MLHTPRTNTQSPTNNSTRARPTNRHRIPSTRLQQRPRNRSTHQSTKPNNRKRHTQPRPRLRDIVAERGDGGREQRLKGCCAEAVERGPGVVGWDAGDGEPGPEDDGGKDDADGEGVKDADVAVCDEAREDAGWEADAVEDDDHVERGFVGHAEFVAGE